MNGPHADLRTAARKASSSALLPASPTAIQRLPMRKAEMSTALPNACSLTVVVANGFPIYDKRSEFERQVARKIDGTSARTRRLIHFLKPYKSGRKSLWALHNLDILDKHNTILLAAASYRHFVLRSKLPVDWQDAPIEFPGIVIKPKDRLFPLQNGAIVLRIAAVARSENDDNFEFAFEICFGEGNALAGEPLTTLRDLGRMTERIVGMIEKCSTSRTPAGRT